MLGLLALAWACPAAPIVEAPAPTEEAGPRCLRGDLDVGARGYIRTPEDGVSRGVAFNRFRAEGGFRLDSVSLRAVFAVVRSGGDEGTGGIQNDAYVPVLRIAEFRYDHRPLGLSVAAGAVDDIALMPIQAAWGRIDIARPMLTDRAWTPRSDVGGWLSWTSPGSWVTATTAVTAGEGIDQRDLNNQVNTTAALQVRPLGDRRLTIMAWGRHGSRGLLAEADHRLGGAAWAMSPWVVGGVSATLGEGLAGDGTMSPAGGSVWVRSGLEVPAIAWARLDHGSNDYRASGATSTAAFVGGGPRLPWKAGAPGYVALGWEGRRNGPAAPELVGANGGLRTDLWFIQLGGRFAGGVDLPPL